MYFAHPYDPSLRSEIPTTVRVVECFTPEHWFMTKSVAASEKTNRQEDESTTFNVSKIYKRIYKKLGGLAAIPDTAITWLPFAVWQGLRIIRRKKIRAILVTAPPVSSLLIGAVLKRLTGIPLVTEFRDAWISEPARTRVRIGNDKRRQWIERTQEAWVIRAADRVIAVTEGVTWDFITRYSHIEQSRKFITIPNGYDKTDFLELDKTDSMNSASDSRFNIVYTGTLSGVRTPKYFLQAIQHLLTERPELRSRLRITLVGLCGRFADGSGIDDYVQAFQLQDAVELVGFVSREESLRYQVNADLLLLLIGLVPASESQCYGLSAKVFDYALTGKPVLAIAEDGPTSDFVQSAGIGEVVSHYDQAGIIAAVERALAEELYYAPRQTVIDEYDYAVLMRRLEAVLSSLSGV
jgi:glycosyltransferase involved in cell wall biosynthesis